MRRRLSIKFNTLSEGSLENIVRISVAMSRKYSNNIEKVELIPSLSETYEIHLNDDLLLSKAITQNLSEEEVEELLLSRLEKKQDPDNNGKDCFGWKCSDVLRNIERK